MNPDLIISAVNIFLTYMYIGNIHAGEASRPLGLAIDYQGYYNFLDSSGTMHYNLPSELIYLQYDLESVYCQSTGSTYNFHIVPAHDGDMPNASTFTMSISGSTTTFSSGAYYDWYVYFPDNENSPQYVDTISISSSGVPNVFYSSGLDGRTWVGNGSIVTNSTDLNGAGFPTTLYLPIDPDATYTYDDVVNNVILPAIDIKFPDLNITASDFVQETDLLATETETETGSCCGCDCTTIYVNADGSLTLSNEISGDYALTIDNNAELSLNVNAAAGAFGAGAIVIDPEAEINITAGAGAFGAGAFGAGAIVSPNVDVSGGTLEVGDISGEINVSEISGELSLQASEVSVSGSVEFSGDLNLTGGDINVDQSGSTVTNNYYYQQDPSEPGQEPFTLDYDEILSEGELESILNQETYSLSLETISFTDGYQIDVPELSSVPSEVVGTASSLIDYGANVISDTGLMSIYAPLSIFSIICYILRGCK